MPEPHFLNVLNLDESGRRELLSKLDAWRGTAQPKALVGTTLELGARYINADPQGDERSTSARRSDFIQCRQQNCRHFPWPLTRPVPASFTECHTAVRIVRALQAGHNLHSQVYVATFDVDGDGDDEDATANEVVIKIYQPSMSPGIPSLRGLYGRPRHWTVLLSCQDEEWAYRQMMPLHGNFVPHAYGFFHVSLPHGEPAIALVMEKINTVADDILAMRVREQCAGDESRALNVVADVVLAAGHAMHTCNISTVDTINLSKNLLWPEDSFTQPGLSFPVLVDFGMASPIYPSVQSLVIKLVAAELRILRFNDDLIDGWLQSLLGSPSTAHEEVPEYDLQGSEILRLFDVPYSSATDYPGSLQAWFEL